MGPGLAETRTCILTGVLGPGGIGPGLSGTRNGKVGPGLCIPGLSGTETIASWMFECSLKRVNKHYL